MFYRHASAALLVFDLADRKTFEDLQSWIQGIIYNIIENKAWCSPPPPLLNHYS